MFNVLAAPWIATLNVIVDIIMETNNKAFRWNTLAGQRRLCCTIMQCRAIKPRRSGSKLLNRGLGGPQLKYFIDNLVSRSRYCVLRINSRFIVWN